MGKLYILETLLANWKRHKKLAKEGKEFLKRHKFIK